MLWNNWVIFAFVFKWGVGSRGDCRLNVLPFKVMNLFSAFSWLEVSKQFLQTKTANEIFLKIFYITKLTDSILTVRYIYWVHHYLIYWDWVRVANFSAADSIVLFSYQFNRKSECAVFPHSLLSWSRSGVWREWFICRFVFCGWEIWLVDAPVC